MKIFIIPLSFKNLNLKISELSFHRAHCQSLAQRGRRAHSRQLPHFWRPMRRLSGFLSQLLGSIGIRADDPAAGATRITGMLPSNQGPMCASVQHHPETNRMRSHLAWIQWTDLKRKTVSEWYPEVAASIRWGRFVFVGTLSVYELGYPN